MNRWFATGVGLLGLFGTAGLAAAAEGHGGKPSLWAGDPGNIIWTLVVFVVLLLVLGKFAWGPILKVLKDREEFIRQSLADARKDREEAQKQLEEYKRQLDRSREEGAAIINEGRREAEAVKDGIVEQARGESEQMIARAREEIGMARDQAVQAIYDRTAELATDIAGKIISRELSSEDHRDLVQQTLEELDQRRPD